MRIMDFERERAAALDLARLGGRVAMGHFQKSLRTSRKADGTWVTEADWAVEAQIRLTIARSFPDHNILGEEEGLTAAGGGSPRPGAPTWVVDPIDGTNNYMSGIPVWATLVALVVDEVPVVGVCHAPALQETYDASVGAGARFNGSTIRVDPLADLAQATILLADAKDVYAQYANFWRGLLDTAWRSRGFGDFWGHMLVARGSAHVMAEPQLSLWDVAALQPIVREAGGNLTQFDGTPWSDGQTCLTTNGALHDHVTALARDGA